MLITLEFGFNNNTATGNCVYLTYIVVGYYSNADTDKLQILKDNKGKAGVYLFMHNESPLRMLARGKGKKYVLLKIYNVD
jgi:hypothetical protein